MGSREEDRRGKMPVSERAKQFMPFSPLRGLGLALAEQERVRVSKPVLCEDQIAVLNERLRLLQKGMEIDVFFHRDNEICRVQGIVTRVDAQAQVLGLKEEIVHFTELLNICFPDTRPLSQQSGDEDFQSDEE